MKPDQEWLDKMPMYFFHQGATDVVRDLIRRIQMDALAHAADICIKLTSAHHSAAHVQVTTDCVKAIMAEAEEVEQRKLDI
jgi:hypothetical protein